MKVLRCPFCNFFELNKALNYSLSQNIWGTGAISCICIQSKINNNNNNNNITVTYLYDGVSTCCMCTRGRRTTYIKIVWRFVFPKRTKTYVYVAFSSTLISGVYKFLFEKLYLSPYFFNTTWAILFIKKIIFFSHNKSASSSAVTKFR